MRVTYNYMTMRYLTGIQNNLNSVSNTLDAVTKGRNLLTPEQDPVKLHLRSHHTDHAR
ncbi:MAG: hypothetical protein LRY51_03825 [Geovibrio sp.]|nr:hypothetical protein [Geovibrio sp.]